MFSWKIALIICGVITLSTGLVKNPGFWTSYAADIAGPAMGYILLRGQFSPKRSFFSSVKMTPGATFLLITAICFLIETGQYLNLYKAHFDPYDYIAYISLLIPLFIIDKSLSSRHNN